MEIWEIEPSSRKVRCFFGETRRGWNWRAWVRRVGYAGMNVPFSPTSESARLLMPASRKRLDLRSFGEGRVGRGQRLGKFNSWSGETSRFLKPHSCGGESSRVAGGLSNSREHCVEILAR